MKKGLLRCMHISFEPRKIHDVRYSMKNKSHFSTIRYADIKLPKSKISVMVDSGSSITLISKDIFDLNYSHFQDPSG